MPTVNMHDAKSQLSQLVEAAERGETVVIARNGKPAAQLVGLQQSPPLRGWSSTMSQWFSTGQSLELELDRSDLKSIPERESF